MIFYLRLEYADMMHKAVVRADDQEQAIAIAWARLRRLGWLTLPMAYTSARVERVDDESDEECEDGARF
jgi:hypothetical protein